MNKKLKELALRAGAEYCAGTILVNGKDANDLMQKFAALIVAECADAADMAYDCDCAYPGDYVGESMDYGEEHGITEWRFSVRGEA